MPDRNVDWAQVAREAIDAEKAPDSRTSHRPDSSAAFSEYAGLVRRIEDESRRRSEADRAILTRVKEMHEELASGNSELWRSHRDGVKTLDQRLDRVEGLVARALGSVNHLSGGLHTHETVDAQRADHLSKIDQTLGSILGRLDDLKRSPRIKSAFWGAVGAPLALVAIGLVSWGLKRAGVNIGWPP